MTTVSFGVIQTVSSDQGGGVGSDDVTVRFEPCGTFLAESDPTTAACSECGWFEEDHWFAELDRPATPAAAPVKEPALTARA
jgi:hypothetical protein